ncbi:MAG: thioredoxin family protein [Candidatus Melainabacteria bacterium]|nr:thioredoxin family protein [Candidatus Melainabacteria bacterium]
MALNFKRFVASGLACMSQYNISHYSAACFTGIACAFLFVCLITGRAIANDVTHPAEQQRRSVSVVPVVPPPLSLEQTPALPSQFQQPCQLVLLEFYASWCRTCQYVDPYVKALKREIAPTATVLQLDVDEPVIRSLMPTFRVTGTPMFILFNTQGKAIYKMERQISPSVLRQNVLAQVKANQKAIKQCRHSAHPKQKGVSDATSPAE